MDFSEHLIVLQMVFNVLSAEIPAEHANHTITVQAARLDFGEHTVKTVANFVAEHVIKPTLVSTVVYLVTIFKISAV